MYTLYAKNPEEAKRVLDDIFLVKCLIDLNGLNLTKAAELMGVQRSNLSAWLSGKPNVFSASKRESMLSALGMQITHDALSDLRHISLSRNTTHSWAIRSGSTALFEFLSHIESGELLKNVEAIRIDAIPYGTFSILRSHSYAGEVFIMLSPFKPPPSTMEESLNEGLENNNIIGSISIELTKWMDWQIKRPSPADLSRLLDQLTFKPNQFGFEKQSNVVSELKKNRHSIEIAGLAELIHELLNEIQRFDPTNDLLDPIVRESIYLRGISYSSSI